MTESILDVSQTVAECAANRPSLARIFVEHEIDLCRDGRKTVLQACREREIEPQRLVAELAEAARLTHCEVGLDGDQASITELCDHIATVHHACLRQELTMLSGIINKVAKVYRAAQPELEELKRTFERFRDRLERHLTMETGVLWPALRELDTCVAPPAILCEHLRHCISEIEVDHDFVDEQLQRIRRLTNGYTLPGGVCATYAAMVDSLWQLECNLHRAIHEEDEYLFPKALRRTSLLPR